MCWTFRHFAGPAMTATLAALTILALARLGHLASADGGKSFSLRGGG